MVIPRVEKCKPSPSDPIYISGHFLLGYLVVATALKQAVEQATGETPPPDGERKCIDAASKRVTVGSATHWRIANSVSLLSV